MPSLEDLRTVVFKAILSKAFDVSLARVEHLLREEGWNSFTDFMAAVERSGRVLFQFKESKKIPEMPEEKREAAVEAAYAKANTDAMNHLLSSTFFGPQSGHPDPALAIEALEPFEIDSWKKLSMTLLQLAAEVYAESTGKILLEISEPETLMLYGLEVAPDANIMNTVMKAFGMPTLDHLKAVYSGIKAGDLTPEDMNRAIGHPELLTELVNRSPANPYKGIRFSPVDNPMGL
jgi:hypothetical protein